MDAGRNIEFVKVAAQASGHTAVYPTDKQEKRAQLDIPAYVPDMPSTSGINTVQQVSAPAPAAKTDATPDQTGGSGKLDKLKAAVLASLSNPKVRKLLDNEKVRAVISNPTLKKIINSPLLRNPTESGIVGAIGGGLTTAALAAAYRSRNNEKKRKNSLVTNPVLLGLLGAAGGYVAGNKLDTTLKPSKDLSKTKYRLFPRPISEAASKLTSKVRENLGLGEGTTDWPTYKETDDGTVANIWHGLGTQKGKIPYGTLTGAAAIPALASKLNAIANGHDLQSGFEAAMTRQHSLDPAKAELNINEGKLGRASKALERVKERVAGRVERLNTDITSIKNQLDAAKSTSKSIDRAIAKYQARNQTVPQSLLISKNNAIKLINEHQDTLRELLLDSKEAVKPVSGVQKEIDKLTKKIEAARKTIASEEGAIAAQVETLANGSHLNSVQAKTLRGQIGRIIRNLYPNLGWNKFLKGLTASERQIWNIIQRANKSRLRAGTGWLALPAAGVAMEGLSGLAPSSSTPKGQGIDIDDED